MTEPHANDIVFICHNAVDRPYAQALEGIIHALLENKDRPITRGEEQADRRSGLPDRLRKPRKERRPAS
jgi:hypothetical protein